MSLAAAALFTSLVLVSPLVETEGAPPAIEQAASRAPAQDDAPAQDETEPVAPAEQVLVEVFGSVDCPYCRELYAFLDDLVAERGDPPWLTVVIHEVWHDAAGRAELDARAAELDFRAEAVPITVVSSPTTLASSQVWVGFSPAIGRGIDAAIVEAAIIEAAGQPFIGPPSERPAAEPGTGSSVIDVPFVGSIDVEGRSLLLATSLIAVVDGFNPCSLWVLTVLLALVLHTGSRRRVILVGGTFLLVTTAIYGLFIVGVYSALSLVAALAWIRVVVAAFALTFGVVNVKDYLWFKVGPSFTIADERKPEIYRRARGLVRPGVALPAAMLGAATMAAGVALIEIPCTAGFPVIWSDLVGSAGVSGVGFAGLLGLYLAIYLFDELLVFGAAVATMRVTKLQERHGRALKLVGGMVMVTIGLTILLAPDLLDRPSGIIVVFALAAAGSAVVAIVERVVRRSNRRPTTSPPPTPGPAGRADEDDRPAARESALR